MQKILLEVKSTCLNAKEINALERYDNSKSVGAH